LEVRLEGAQRCPGCRVQARSGYYAGAGVSSQPRNDLRAATKAGNRATKQPAALSAQPVDFEELVSKNRILYARDQPLDLRDIPLAITTSKVMDDKGKAQIKVDLQIQDSNIRFETVEDRHTGKLRITTFYMDSKGKILGSEWKIMDMQLLEETYLISGSIREHKGNRGGKEGNPGRTRGRQRIAGLSAAQKPMPAQQFAACPEFRVWRSRLRRGSGTPRPDGRLAGIRVLWLRCWALLPRAGASVRRSAGFERILGFAALAFPMAQDAVDHPRLCNNRDDLHPGAALADQRVNFKGFSEQARPGASGFPGEVGIVLLCAGFGCRTGSLANGG